MSIESTIKSLLEDALVFGELTETQATRGSTAADPKKGIEADQSAEDEPSNKRNNVVTQKDAEGGTSKKPDEATRGAKSPDAMVKLKEGDDEDEDDEDEDDEDDDEDDDKKDDKKEVNELSRGTLQSYARKAATQSDYHYDRAAALTKQKLAGQTGISGKQIGTHINIGDKRSAGVRAAQDKISNRKYGVREDVDALFNGEDGLTEEFRKKAETIFETAVTSRIKTEVAAISEELQEHYESQFQTALDEATEGLVEHIDGYLNLMVEQWMEKNEVALVSGMKADILESFVGGLKGLFEEHYIDVPEEKFDILESLEAKNVELEEKLNEAIQLNVQLNSALTESIRTDIVSRVCEGLTDIEAEKLQTLAEEIAFESADEYAEKLQTIRENYFVKKSGKKGESAFLTEETIQEEKVVPADMTAYVKTISVLNR